ncbi:MAG TPA: hypothetical protein VH114_04885 [Candidatus Acidoferrum sp.]|nr:hypothetical protein [Candidatus Acidoferrum sp.]
MWTRSWGAAAASLITVLALLVAPNCVSLCAAQACSQAPGASAEAPCHFAAGSQNGGVHLHPAGRNCGAPDLQATAPASFTKRDALKTERATAFADPALVLSPELPSALKPHSGACCSDSPPAGHASSSAVTTILRI